MDKKKKIHNDTDFYNALYDVNPDIAYLAYMEPGEVPDLDDEEFERLSKWCEFENEDYQDILGRFTIKYHDYSFDRLEGIENEIGWRRMSENS